MSILSVVFSGGRRVGHIAALVALSLAVLLPSALPAFAQGTVPPALLENKRPMQGDQIRFCIDDTAPAAAFNRAVSQAIADALLVNAEFVPGLSSASFPLDGLGFMDELQLAMNETCDVYVGISIQPEGNSAYPAWATVSRPFAQIPFVVVVKNPAYNSLGDVPPGVRVGSTMGSIAQMMIISYTAQQAENRRWVSLPYADPKLMLKRLLDGTLDAMAIYQPVLVEIAGKDLEAQGLKIVPFSPVQVPMASVGNLLSARDTYLRTQLDDAIGALVADGTIAKLMEEFGYMGTPGP